MGSYNAAVITTAGQTLLTTAIADQKDVVFSKFQVSNHIYPSGTDLSALTSLAGVQKESTPSGASIYDSTTLTCTATTDNGGVLAEFNANTLGLFITVDSTEVLFAVSTAITPDVYPKDAGGVPSSYTYSMNLGVSTTDQVSISVPMSAYLTAASVVDNLTSTSSNSPLSANMGRELKEMIPPIANNVTTTTAGYVLDARQGKVLKDSVDGKIATSAIANNLTTTTAGSVLDARQGKTLKDAVDGKVATSAIANNLTTTLAGYVLDARQGKILNDGKLSTTGNSANNTVAYTSADDASVFNSGNLGGQSAYAWTATAKIATGEKHSVLFNKVSTMFKNIRTIAKLIGTTDISSIGTGTISNAIYTINSDLSEIESGLIGSWVEITESATPSIIEIVPTSPYSSSGYIIRSGFCFVNFRVKVLSSIGQQSVAVVQNLPSSIKFTFKLPPWSTYQNYVTVNGLGESLLQGNTLYISNVATGDYAISFVYPCL